MLKDVIGSFSNSDMVVKYHLYFILGVTLLTLIFNLLRKKNMKNMFTLPIIVFIILYSIYCIIYNCGTNINTAKNTTTTKAASDTTTTSTTVTTTTKSSNKTSNGFTITTKDGATYIDGYLIVNKTYSLPSDWVPTDTYQEASATGYCQLCINNEAYDAWLEMKNDASDQGLKIWIQSGYRSYDYQKKLYNSYVEKSGQTAADTYSARPGNSEHQTGLAFDLNSISDAFASTDEGIWVNENCYKYGFILRYPDGKSDETGYKYESWHLRYVGVDLATKLYNNGDWITLESYFGIDSKYS